MGHKQAVEVTGGVVLVLVVSAMLAGVSRRPAVASAPPTAAVPGFARELAEVVDLPTSGHPRGVGNAIANPFSAVLRADHDLDGGCVWLEAVDGKRIAALWPVGYRVRFEKLAAPAVVDQSGRVVAKAGQRFPLFVLPWSGAPPGRCAVSTERVIAVVR